ncbi:hypothetical protein V2J09_006644 [Rumex salicifolius]
MYYLLHSSAPATHCPRSIRSIAIPQFAIPFLSLISTLSRASVFSGDPPSFFCSLFLLFVSYSEERLLRSFPLFETKSNTCRISRSSRC